MYKKAKNQNYVKVNIHSKIHQYFSFNMYIITSGCDNDTPVFLNIAVYWQLAVFHDNKVGWQLCGETLNPDDQLDATTTCNHLQKAGKKTTTDCKFKLKIIYKTIIKKINNSN